MLFINLPYFIKEHLWMNASDEATLKKNFWWSSKLVQKQNKMVPQLWLLLILEIVENWSRVLQINIFKKIYTLNPSHLPLQEMYVTIATWLTGVYMVYILTEIPEEKHLKSKDYFKYKNKYKVLWLL